MGVLAWCPWGWSFFPPIGAQCIVRWFVVSMCAFSCFLNFTVDSIGLLNSVGSLLNSIEACTEKVLFALFILPLWFTLIAGPVLWLGGCESVNALFRSEDDFPFIAFFIMFSVALSIICLVFGQLIVVRSVCL